MAVRKPSGRTRLRLVALTAVALALGGTAAPGAWSAGAAADDPGVRADLPDMAVLVTGGSGRSTTLHSGEPGFARLWQLMEPTYTGTERVPRAWAQGRYPAPRVTVVWGLTGVGGWPRTSRPPGGDVAMERLDQLLLAADGTPWVRSDPAPDVTDDDIRWHRASRGVFRQLERSGLVAADGAPGPGPGADTGTGSGASGWDRTTDGAWWAVSGLAVGVAGTLLIRRAAARREAGPPRDEPRQELIDLDL
ncbi:hypothetical protein [Streptomyces sp. NPDC054794]